MSGETTWRLVPDRETDRIRIGDRVRVASTHRFYEDWKDVDLEVVGIACTPLGDLNYTLSEDWPRDGGFDDWRERDLVVVSAPKPPAGLYEVREDGTARRVEVDVVRFIRKLIADVWDGCTPDGGDIEDLAIQCGILAEVAFDPKQHDDPLCAAEPGDPWFVFSDAFRALTGEER